jgi:hypothetical protein
VTLSIVEHETLEVTLLKNSKNMQKTLFKPKPLTVPFVFSNLKEIALSTGHSVSRAIVHSDCKS